jgi:hypothetical protein
MSLATQWFYCLGIYLLQPTYTPQEKKEGLKRHAILQILAYTSAVIGATAIFYNKAIHDKPHITRSTHLPPP